MNKGFIFGLLLAFAGVAIFWLTDYLLIGLFVAFLGADVCLLSEFISYRKSRNFK